MTCNTSDAYLGCVIKSSIVLVVLQHRVCMYEYVYKYSIIACRMAKWLLLQNAKVYDGHSRIRATCNTGLLGMPPHVASMLAACFYKQQTLAHHDQIIATC